MLVNAGFCKMVSKANKGSAMMSLMITSIITSRKAELDQLSLGLGPVLKEARKNPEMCKRLFVYDESVNDLSPERATSLLYMDQLESNLQGYLKMYMENKGNLDFSF